MVDLSALDRIFPGVESENDPVSEESPRRIHGRDDEHPVIEAADESAREVAGAASGSVSPEPVASDGGSWHGFTRSELLSLAGPDERSALEADPDLLEAFAFALRLTEIRACGERPDHYTRAAYCTNCGPVWLFPGGAKRVLGCPWCENKANGLPIPLPPVTCSDCLHWRADGINPSGGLGSCVVEALASKRPGSLWRRGEIYCGTWCPANEEVSR